MKTMLSVLAEPVCGLLSVNEDTYLIQKCQVMHITDWSFSIGGMLGVTVMEGVWCQ